VLDCEYRLEKKASIIRMTNTKMKDTEPPKALVFELKNVDLD